MELIVGGEVAREREFPHMALIGYNEGRIEGRQGFFKIVDKLSLMIFKIIYAAVRSYLISGYYQLHIVPSLTRVQQTSQNWVILKGTGTMQTRGRITSFNGHLIPTIDQEGMKTTLPFSN